MNAGEILGTADVRLLAEIGFIALSAGRTRDAEAIFLGVSAARPEQEAGALGMAMTHMADGNLQGAISVLRSLAPTDAALTYLGIALARSGEIAEAKRLFSSVINTSAESPFGVLAQASLDNIDE